MTVYQLTNCNLISLDLQLFPTLLFASVRNSRNFQVVGMHQALLFQWQSQLYPRLLYNYNRFDIILKPFVVRV